MACAFPGSGPLTRTVRDDSKPVNGSREYSGYGIFRQRGKKIARPRYHFCLVALALERVGDRWSLLVIRDLLTGAKRFTDLMDRLGGITPKTVSYTHLTLPTNREV